MNNKLLYKQVLLDGCSVDYKNLLSLCVLNNYYGGKHFKQPKYQIHCDCAKAKCSELYDDLDEALDKFLELKEKVRDRQ